MSHTIDHDVFDTGGTSVLSWYSVSRNEIPLAEVLAVSLGDAVASAKDIFGEGAPLKVKVNSTERLSPKVIITVEAKARAMIIMEKDVPSPQPAEIE